MLLSSTISLRIVADERSFPSWDVTNPELTGSPSSIYFRTMVSNMRFCRSVSNMRITLVYCTASGGIHKQTAGGRHADDHPLSRTVKDL
jgi:hypothetical protein